MFDKIHITPAKSENTFHTHNISLNRAPTDESLKLLKEFEEKAEEKYLSKFEVADNELNLLSLDAWHEFTGERTCVIKFKLNGQEYTSKQKTKQVFDDSKEGRVEQARGLIQKMADEIVLLIVTKYSDKFVKTIMQK